MSEIVVYVYSWFGDVDESHHSRSDTVFRYYTRSAVQNDRYEQVIGVRDGPEIGYCIYRYRYCKALLYAIYCYYYILFMARISMYFLT